MSKQKMMALHVRKFPLSLHNKVKKYAKNNNLTLQEAYSILIKNNF